MAIVAIAAVVGVGLAYGSYLLSNQSNKQKVQGSRIGSSSLTTSTEGAGLARLFGRQRLDAQIIWATKFKETVSTTTSEVETGGKRTSSKQEVETTNYTYSISLALAFCAGNDKADVSRMWADGKPLALSSLNYRFYTGSSTQMPDTKIEEIEGLGNAPAYRGVCYMVIEDLDLSKFGNRVPQITAEIVVPVKSDSPIDIQNSAEAFTLIPSSGESAYATTKVKSINGKKSKPDNIHNALRKPDAKLSINQLRKQADNLDAVSITVAWFGDDLRAGSCTIRPMIEDAGRKLDPVWSVGSYVRGNTPEVSRDADDRPNFGGTPSDQSVIELIQYLKSKGKRVVFYPFILMDVTGANTLPNPYSDNAGGSGQPAFPWRGRITVSPATGFGGSADLAGVAASQINNFFDEYDEMIEHYASLCAAAGGVDGFIIGSELIGLTTSRDALGSYPAVDRLISLAATVKGIVGSGTDVTYAADWSEWTHNTVDGLWFHLDPLWASPNIDVIGVDNYLPLSDWRDGTAHLDYDNVTGPVSNYEPSYIASQIEGGEYFDYYYASRLDRDNQIRTPITDGAYGKPWVYRAKDYRSWWTNEHYNRPAGVENGSPTAWVPESKPIWFTEFGVPSVDKGTNQPNVFVDPKSSESAYPHYSTHKRDDFIQRVAVETMLDYWRNNSPSAGGVTMVEPKNMFIWTWDARPFPDYPNRSNVWSDGAQWFKGHWWTGKIDAVPLHLLIRELCLQAGLPESRFDVSGLYGPGALVRGYQVERPEPIRQTIEVLMSAYLFDGFESEGKIKFVLRSNTKTYAISGGDYVVSAQDPVGIMVKDGQETDLPTKVNVVFVNEFNDYNSGAVDGKTSRGYSQNIEELDFLLTLSGGYARGLADTIVQQRWTERKTGKMTLPPSHARFDPGDALVFPVGIDSMTGRITAISIGAQRDLEFTAFDPETFILPEIEEEIGIPPVADIFGDALLIFMDLPLFTGSEIFPWAPRLAADASPWPGGVNVYKLLADTTYKFNSTQPYRTATGRLNNDLPARAHGVWDRSSVINLTLDYGGLSSVSEIQALDGAVALGVHNSAIDEWEIIQFATATLVGTNTYEVSDLLRGQLGTEHAQGALVFDTVVVLQPQFISALLVSDDTIADTNTFSYGPNRYPQTDDTYTTEEFTGKRVGLRPYSPTDVIMAVNPINDLSISWARRTRFGGDGWAVSEPPLNEELERYRFRIYDGVTVVREIQTDAPNYVYSIADQLADFGVRQTQLDIDVAQFGPHYGGYGSIRTKTLIIGRATL